MTPPSNLEPTRLTHHLVTALLLALLTLPLFFASQIALVLAGANALTVSPARVRVIVQETPPLAIIAPFLRVVLVGAALYTHYKRPGWTLRWLTLSFVAHIIGWTSIIGNPYFNAPTGYITLALELAVFILLVLNPALRGRQV